MISSLSRTPSCFLFSAASIILPSRVELALLIPGSQGHSFSNLGFGALFAFVAILIWFLGT